jgi:two-component system, cell cycle response regulator
MSAAPRPKILVVDDEPANVELLVRMLRRRYDVRTAASGPEALKLLEKERFAAILSDQRMPEMSGTEFLAEARRMVPETVRMILTGYTAEQESLDAINVAHVNTFLTKPIAPDAVERAMADAVTLYEMAIRNQELVTELSVRNQELAEAKQLVELSLDERTRALLEANRRLEALALRDVLTGVYNHRFFQERLAEEMERRRRHGGALSVLLCDLDGFRAFNETHGHEAGDRVLVWVAQLLTGSARASEAVARLRPTDMVARYGGATFAILAPMTTKAGAEALRERIRATLAAAAPDTGPVTLSIGLAEAPTDADQKGALVEAAEAALRAAKPRR